jgi:hypothetical protein
MGLDVHAASCTLGVVGPSGKRLSTQVVETNARALIEVLRAVPGKRHTTVIGRAQEDEPLYRHYERLLAGGTKPNLAEIQWMLSPVTALCALRRVRDRVRAPSGPGPPQFLVASAPSSFRGS